MYIEIHINHVYAFVQMVEWKRIFESISVFIDLLMKLLTQIAM